MLECLNARVAAWIMNASVRENILFGHRYDEDFYNSMAGGVSHRLCLGAGCGVLPEIIEACAGGTNGTVVQRKYRANDERRIDPRSEPPQMWFNHKPDPCRKSERSDTTPVSCSG